MDDNELKRLLEATTAEIKQHFDTAVGRVETRLDTTVEQMNQRFDQVDQRFDQVDQRFEQMDQRFEQVDRRFEQVDQRFDQVDQRFEQVDRRFEGIDQRLDLVEAGNAETRRHADAVAERLEKRFDEASTDLRRHFDVTREHLESRFDALAEAVTLVDAKVDRTAAELRSEMREGFSETHAMIQFSYSALDRRLRAVEEDVAELKK
ncbi:MAG TPA: hypothetical protein VGF69_08580 [Thermoanaerobaculia bacterium]